MEISQKLFELRLRILKALIFILYAFIDRIVGIHVALIVNFVHIRSYDYSCIFWSLVEPNSRVRLRFLAGFIDLQLGLFKLTLLQIRSAVFNGR